MKKLLFLFLLIFVFCSGVVTAASTQYRGFDIVKVFSGGKQLIATDTPAITIDGRSYVPLYMLRQAGLTVTYDAKTKAVSVELPPPKIVQALTQSQLDELSKSVYKILGSIDDPTKANQGSGFIVNGTMITNFHVAGDYSYAQVEIEGNKQKVTQYQFTNKDVDLMGFKVEGGKSLPISTQLPQPGDIVYAIGYPHGELKVTEGKVHYVSIEDGKKQIVHSAEVAGGSSGGVLLNGQGEIIGINRAGGGMIEGIVYAWAIPTMYLENELK